MDRFSAKNVNALLRKNGVRASKSMGQNFLIDDSVTVKIVEMADFTGADSVLEVGAGLGILTLALSNTVKHVTAVELDKRLLPALRELFSGISNVDIVQGDILKLDIGKLVEDTMPGGSRHVCANLPYNITTPALTLFIDSGLFQTITVMMQREVAQRICAKPGSPEYGAFTVYANYHTVPEILFTVPPECFIPRPGVYSAVVKMKKHDGRILGTEEEAMFFRAVRAAFSQRRKTLVNALYAVFGNKFSKEELAKMAIECGFDERVRGEMLSIEQFAALSKMLM